MSKLDIGPREEIKEMISDQGKIPILIGGCSEKKSFEILSGFGERVFEELDKKCCTLKWRSKCAYLPLEMVTAIIGLVLFFTL